MDGALALSINIVFQLNYTKVCVITVKERRENSICIFYKWNLAVITPSPPFTKL